MNLEAFSDGVLHRLQFCLHSLKFAYIQNLPIAASKQTGCKCEKEENQLKH
jgi:hypothetical protein